MGRHRRYKKSVRVSALVLAAATWTATLEVRHAAGAQESASSGSSTVRDGVFTTAQATRGQRLYKTTCTSCHDVRDYTGRKFAAKWQGLSLGELFDMVSNTMPENDPGSLLPEEYAAIFAFLLKESGYKQGEKELPSDVDSLNKIMIEPLP